DVAYGRAGVRQRPRIARKSQKKRRSSRGKEERGERDFEGCRSEGNSGRPRDRGKVPWGSEPKAHGGWALGRGTWQIIPTNFGLRGRPFCSGSSSFFL